MYSQRKKIIHYLVPFSNLIGSAFSAMEKVLSLWICFNLLDF